MFNYLIWYFLNSCHGFLKNLILNVVHEPIRHHPQKTEIILSTTSGNEVTMDYSLNTRKLSDVSGISQTSAQIIFKHHKCCPHKMHIVQELNEDDFDCHS